MTQTVKRALDTMKSLNPYENSTPERDEAYLAIWNAMQTLRNLDIISADEWNAIFEQDHKMYDKAD